MPGFFSVSENEIIVYKHKVYGPIQIVAGAVLIPLLVYLLVHDLPAYNKMIAVCATAIATPLLLIYLRFEKIVFDLNNKVVYRWLPVVGRLHIAAFDEIAGVDFVRINRGFLSPFVKHTSYCRIVLKKDRFGAGIKILSQIKNDMAELVPFNTEVVQRLNQIFTSEQHAGGVAVAEADSHWPAEAFKYVKQDSNGLFKIGLSMGKWVRIVCWVCLLFIMYQAFVQGGTFKDYIDAIIYIGFPSFFLYLIYTDSKTVSFDTHNRIISVHHLGVFEKQYGFSDFYSFHLVRNTLNMIYTGTDLYIVLQNGKSLAVVNYYNTQKLKELTQELQTIIQTS